MQGLPEELFKAARVDGGGFWTIFLRVLLPMSTPMLIVAVILQVTGIWNDFILGLVFAGRDNLPMTVQLNNIVNSQQGRKTLQMSTWPQPCSPAWCRWSSISSPADGSSVASQPAPSSSGVATSWTWTAVAKPDGMRPGLRTMKGKEIEQVAISRGREMPIFPKTRRQTVDLGDGAKSTMWPCHQ